MEKEPVSTIIFPNNKLVEIPANDIAKIKKTMKMAIAEHLAIINKSLSKEGK